MIEPITQPVPEMRVCACPCGRSFPAGSNGRKYYHPKNCANKHKRWLARQANPQTCLYCGRLIEYLPGERLGGKPKEWCDEKHRRKYQYHHRTEAQKDAAKESNLKAKRKARNAAASETRKAARAERNAVEPVVTVRPTLSASKFNGTKQITRVEKHINAGIERVIRAAYAKASETVRAEMRRRSPDILTWIAPAPRKRGWSVRIAQNAYQASQRPA